MRKNLLGALIGFASGLYVASALLNTVFTRNSFITTLDTTGFIFVYSGIIAAFSLFGIHCMSDNIHSKNRRKLNC